MNDTNTALAAAGIDPENDPCLVNEDYFTSWQDEVQDEAVKIAEKVELGEEQKKTLFMQVTKETKKIGEIAKTDLDLAHTMKSFMERLLISDFNGCFEMKDDRVYHLGIGVAQGALQRFRKSAENYHHAVYVDYNKDTKSKSMLEGDFFHKCILQPDRLGQFVDESKIIDEVMKENPEVKSPRGTKAYKERAAALREQGKELISNEIYSELDSIVGRIHNHPKAKNVLKNGVSEHALYCLDKRTGLVLRAKPDWITSDGFMIDYKTTKDITSDEFARSIIKFGYHIQAAGYLHIADQVFAGVKKGWLWICQERKAPFEMAMYTPIEAVLDKGEEEYFELLDLAARCYRTQTWPPFSTEIQTIDLPYWAYNQN